MTGWLEVLTTGPQTLVQDLGRPGYAAVGVTRSGAADRAAYRLGGRLVAHPEGLAALEVTLGGFSARAHGALTVCVTGAPAPLLVDGRVAGHAAVTSVADGQLLELGAPPSGMRSYLTVRGGIEVDPVLGSRSTDTLSGLGPAPISAGDRLLIGGQTAGVPNIDVAPVRLPPAGLLRLRVLPGPRLDWFAAPELLELTPWTVSERSNRIGVRLDGLALARRALREGAEVPSEGMVPGAIQVPPSGLPVILLADHPVTGGYPVIGVLLRVDIDRAAQARPGQRVALHWSDGALP
jgi:biotin-dependent carboxylase-like uncharacterized protein